MLVAISRNFLQLICSIEECDVVGWHVNHFRQSKEIHTFRHAYGIGFVESNERFCRVDVVFRCIAHHVIDRDESRNITLSFFG